MVETLDDLINEATDPRETKRALAVKMLQNQLSPEMIAGLLNVSVQYVSKWKTIYGESGVAGLRLAYKGSKSYLSGVQRQQVIEWIQSHETLSVEAVRDYLVDHFQVIYASKQSYYDLLTEGGMSYHQTSAMNPKYDEDKVLGKRDEIKKSGTAPD
ncbi:MAG: hypothetical protein Phog2KO_47320 [Phototrophicaceae bacterium]